MIHRSIRSRCSSAGRIQMRWPNVRELGAYLAGEASLDEAKSKAQMLTRRYAKRQLTWMRNQMADWPRVDPGYPDWCR